MEDPERRELCDIEEHARANLKDSIVHKLREAGVVKGEIVACDAAFIKAYSKRDPKGDSKGYSDPEARVGRAGKTYQLGYRLHLAVDAHSELPLAAIAAPANENEKKHAPKLLKMAVKASNGQIKVFVADSQHSSRRLRKNISSHGIDPIIPYPSNQKPVEAEFLRVDKSFRAHGPERLKSLYAYEASAERAISRLKQHLSLENHKVRALRNILTHALLCIIAMLLTALTAIKHGKPDKIRAVTSLT